jgi:chromate transporter
MELRLEIDPEQQHVIAATAVQLLWSTAHRAPSVWGAGLLFLAALLATLVAKGRWAAPVLVVSGALGGRLLFG